MTGYDKVYKAFLAEIQDDLYNMPDFETDEVIQSDFISLLNKAIVEFSYPKVDLRKKNDLSQQFEEDLGLEEIEILAAGMVLAWARKEVYNIDLTRQAMTTKDFTSYSQAAHINSLIKLKNDSEKRLKKMLVKYSIRNKDYTNNLHKLGE